MADTLEQLQHLCDLPEGSGAVESMHAIGRGVCVITDSYRLFLVSPEGDVAEVTSSVLGEINAS